MFQGSVEGYLNPIDIATSRKLEGNEKYEDIITYLKKDFDIDLPLVKTEELTIAQNIVLLNQMIQYYNALAEINQRKIESHMAYIKKVLMSNLGYSKRKVDKIFNPTKPKINIQKIFWFSNFMASTLYLLTTITFVSGFTILLWIYIKSIICI
jgi:hypothetical protein